MVNCVSVTTYCTSSAVVYRYINNINCDNLMLLI